MLEISGSRVRELLGSGQLPGTKRGGAWFIRRRDVEAFALCDGAGGEAVSLADAEGATGGPASK
jgi:hypothetical protein